MTIPTESTDRVVATLVRRDPSPALGSLPRNLGGAGSVASSITRSIGGARIVRSRFPLSPRLLKMRAHAALGAHASGLIIQSVGRDRHVPVFRINWRHPLALPFCCFLCLLIPCVIVWRAPVIYERRHLIRRSLQQWRSGRRHQGKTTKAKDAI